MYNEFSIPHLVVEDKKFKELSHRAVRLYIYMAKLKNRYEDNEGWFWRSIKTLAEDTGMSERSISYAKKELMKLGLLEIKRGIYVEKLHRSPDWYKLNGYVKRI